MVPSASGINFGGRKQPFRLIYVHLMPPKETVIIVTSKGKIGFLDFVVYVFSCISFWFGVCPPSASTTNFDPTSIYNSFKEIIIPFVYRRAFRENRHGRIFVRRHAANGYV
jgi:hypothetical protein